jgi:hypothetical protein
LSGRLVGLGIILIVIGGLLFYYFVLSEATELVLPTTWGPRDWIYESFPVPAGKYVYRWAVLPNVSMVSVEYNVTFGHAIDFLSLDEEDFLRWLNGASAINPFPSGNGVAEASISFSVPHGGTWFFIWNNVSPSELMEVSANVTWTGQVVEYTEVAKPRSLDEQVCGAIGVIVLIVGLIVVVFGLAGLFSTYRFNRSARLREQSLLQALCCIYDFFP